MIKTGLLAAKNLEYLAHLRGQVEVADVALFIAGSVEGVKRIFEQESIDIVFLGRESEPEYRLQILEHIFEVSPTSSVHLLGKGGDPLSFVNGVLKGLVD